MDSMWDITTNQTEIKLWAKAHLAAPELLDYEEAGSDEFVLRLDFPGRKDNVFLAETPAEKKISWDKFFEIFNEKDLVFEYIKDYEGNDPDMAYRFIKRDTFKS